MTSSAISAQGSVFKIGTGTGSAKTITGIALGNPTIITSTSHGLSNGNVVALAGLTGADAATLNGQSVVITNVTTNTFAVNIDTTGKTITAAGTATPVTYTQVKNLKQFQGINGQPSDIDVTNCDSTAKEFRPGLVDYGTFTADIDRDTSDAGQLALAAAQAAGTVQNFTLTLPNGKVASFQGYVKKFDLTGGVDKVLTTACEIRHTGSVTIA